MPNPIVLRDVCPERDTACACYMQIKEVPAGVLGAIPAGIYHDHTLARANHNASHARYDPFCGGNASAVLAGRGKVERGQGTLRFPGAVRTSSKRPGDVGFERQSEVGLLQTCRKEIAQCF